MSKHRRSAFLVVIPACVLIGMIFLWSRSGAFEQNPSQLPSSNSVQSQSQAAQPLKLVTLKITIEGQKPIQATQALGKMITVDYKDSWAIGLIPSLPDSNSNTIMVKLVRVNKAQGNSPSTSEGEAEIDTLEFSKEGDIVSTARALDLPEVSVQLVRVRNTSSKP